MSAKMSLGGAERNGAGRSAGRSVSQESKCLFCFPKHFEKLPWTSPQVHEQGMSENKNVSKVKTVDPNIDTTCQIQRPDTTWAGRVGLRAAGRGELGRVGRRRVWSQREIPFLLLSKESKTTVCEHFLGSTHKGKPCKTLRGTKPAFHH